MEEEALYPFGFGLTYGKVAVTDAKVGKISEETDSLGLPDVSLKVTVQNQGSRDTDDVVQIYIKNTDSADAVRNPVLCAFKRVHVKAGESMDTEISICGRAFSVVGQNGERKKDGNHFMVYAAVSQPDKRSIELTGTEPIELPLVL